MCEIIKMRYFIYFLLFVFLISCKKEIPVIFVEKPEDKPINSNDSTQTNKPQDTIVIIQKSYSLDSASKTNKKTSWFTTNKTFDEIVDVQRTHFKGFMENNGNFSPYIFRQNTIADYISEGGAYFYYDFNKDGKKDVWTWCYKSPFNTNAIGISVFSEYEKNNFTSTNIKIQKVLTSLRKAVVSDLDNDGYDDILMFSQGYDSHPFPGDSICIYYPKDDKYQYLSEDIGFFHGGAAGDINNDGLIDIVAFGLPHMMNNTPTIYINKGNRKFIKSASNNINFPIDGKGGYPSVELYDVDDDGFLDMILGCSNTIKIIKNTNGVFNMQNIINITTDGLPTSFIFYDFNKDKKIDILSINTYNYQGYSINLHVNNGKNYVDETDKYFDVKSHQSKYTWIKWLRMFDYDKDGDFDIVGDGTYGFLENKKIHWKNNDGKFTQTIN